ncbi:MAG: hypothetical protein MI923_07095 [Phycisphaerales bacterium]|nr:hypothetical protein [Phycisphaerales bacterium]
MQERWWPVSEQASIFADWPVLLAARFVMGESKSRAINVSEPYRFLGTSDILWN